MSTNTVSKIAATSLVLCASVVATGTEVNAQTAPGDLRRGETVQTRPRPELDPLGIRAGTFLVYPRMIFETIYDDNVFATENDTDDDFIFSLRPELELRSDWANHALNFSTGLDKGFYASEDDEDYLDYFANLNGRVDVTRDIRLLGGIGFQQLHEPRDDPDDQRGTKPTEYRRYDTFLAYDHQIGRFRGTLDGRVQRLDFDNARGGVQNNDRDRNVYSTSLRVGYQAFDQYETFVRVGGNRREYDTTPDDNGRDRDSHGYNVAAGVSMDLGGLLFGEVFVGYLDQHYPDSNEDDVSGVNFGGELVWNATPLTTVTARVVRDVRETTQTAGGTARLSTTGELIVDHELLRNLIVSANGGVTNDDYEGDPREDFTYQAGIGLRYLMNRHFYASLGYEFTRRSSKDGPGDGEPGSDDDFTRSLVRIGLQGQF